MIRDMKHIGIIAFALGFCLCFASILYAVIYKISLHDLQNIEEIVYVTIATGIGIWLIFVGTNMTLRNEKAYRWLFLLGSVLSFMAIIIFNMHYPDNWYYPLISYVILLYTTGIGILAGNIFINSTVRMRKPDESTVYEEPIPLMYWKTDENERMGVIQNDISNLIVQYETLNESLEDERQNTKSDMKKILLQLLDVLDSFEALFNKIETKEQNADKQTKIWLGNFRAIRKKLNNMLSKFGVSRIESPDGRAIPNVDTIIDTEEREGVEDGTIIEYINRGYAWRREILRKSSVIVVKNNGDIE